jgi:hypothetical protein
VEETDEVVFASDESGRVLFTRVLCTGTTRLFAAADNDDGCAADEEEEEDAWDELEGCADEVEGRTAVPTTENFPVFISTTLR